MTFHQIADQAEEVLRKFDAVRALAESIRGLGNLEQATAEATTAHATAQKELADVRLLVEKRLAAVQKLGVEEKALTATIAEREERSKAAAAEWVESAKKHANSLVDDARAVVNRKLAEGELQLKTLTDRRSALVVEVAQLEAQTTALRAQAANLIG
jgi:membrane carboxypeptidase/penicillin-binding protein